MKKILKIYFWFSSRKLDFINQNLFSSIWTILALLMKFFISFLWVKLLRNKSKRNEVFGSFLSRNYFNKLFWSNSLNLFFIGKTSSILCHKRHFIYFYVHFWLDIWSRSKIGLVFSIKFDANLYDYQSIWYEKLESV